MYADTQVHTYVTYCVSQVAYVCMYVCMYVCIYAHVQLFSICNEHTLPDSAAVGVETLAAKVVPNGSLP